MVTGKDEFLSSRAQLLRRLAALATFWVAPASKLNSIPMLLRGLRPTWGSCRNLRQAMKFQNYMTFRVEPLCYPIFT